MLEKSEGTIKNKQSRDTGNVGHNTTETKNNKTGGELGAIIDFLESCRQYTERIMSIV